MNRDTAFTPQVETAFHGDLGRISINDDWRFIKNDPEGLTNNLVYPRAPGRGGRGQAAPTNTPSPTSGIAEYILPTGNDFISDPAKRYPNPTGNNGDATDLTLFRSSDRKAYNGLALAIVKAKRGRSGVVTVTATSEGLTPTATKIYAY